MSSRDTFYSKLKQFDAYHKIALSIPAFTQSMRFLSYGAYRALELSLGTRHPHERVLDQARKLQRDSPTRPDTGPVVLFFTIRGWFAHIATQVVLAKALEQRGAQPVFFLCDGGLSQCDFKPSSDPFVTSPLCWRCQGFARRLLKAFELPLVTLSDLPTSKTELKVELHSLSLEEIRSLRQGEDILYKVALPSIQRSLLRGDPGEGKPAERTIRGYVEATSQFLQTAEQLISQLRPQTVVGMNGLFSAEHAMRRVCIRRRIPFVNYELGMRNQTVLFDRNRPSAHFHVDELWKAWCSHDLSATEHAELDCFLLEKSEGQQGQNLWPTIDSDEQSLCQRLHIDLSKPTAVLFTNILWDSSLFGRDAGFNSMYHFIQETISWFGKQHAFQLVIRIHPAEVRLPMLESRDCVGDRLRQDYPTLPSNICIVEASDPADSYVITEIAHCVLTYTSTIGLEAAIRSRQVLVAGTPHYRDRGFTCDLQGPASLPADLALAMSCDHPPASHETLARRYAHMFFFRFMQNFPWVQDQPRGQRRLHLDHLSDLAPGEHPVLDRLCAGILNDEPLTELPS
ncbi:MAG: hypothetical protein JRH20_13400 [Deltaproteobacteria bacterium]|nr:hypothetical protein [Deltaproteobacteria bacterium]